jgi:hypothetical protein
VAEEYQNDRVFIAGDAAPAIPRQPNDERWRRGGSMQQYESTSQSSSAEMASAIWR